MEDKNMQSFAYNVDSEVTRIKRFAAIMVLIVALFFFSFGAYFSFLYINSANNQSTPINKFNKIYETLVNEWYYGPEYMDVDEQLIMNAIEGMFDREKDAYTRYVPTVDFLQTSAKGIGISLIEYNDYFYITSVNSSHANMLKIGDVITAIDGVTTKGVPLENISSFTAGKDEVEITYIRGEDTKLARVSIKEYNVITVFSDKDFSEEASYVRIQEFGMNTARELEVILDDISKENLILDLRDNPGGFIDSVLQIGDLFLEGNKTILETRNKDGDSHYYKTSDNDKYEFNKIIILINDGSASGSEALAAALSEHLGDKVILYGETTYGKGSAQKNIPLGDGSVLSYTYALWYSPNGNSINKVGVSPQIEDKVTRLNIYDYDLELYSHGEFVAALQYVLTELGYKTTEWETPNYFSNELVTVLTDFQQEKGIEQTGKLDKRTRRYIAAEIKDKQVSDNNTQLENAFNHLLGVING